MSNENNPSELPHPSSSPRPLGQSAGSPLPYPLPNIIGRRPLLPTTMATPAAERARLTIPSAVHRGSGSQTSPTEKKLPPGHVPGKYGGYVPGAGGRRYAGPGAFSGSYFGDTTGEEKKEDDKKGNALEQAGQEQRTQTESGTDESQTQNQR